MAMSSTRLTSVPRCLYFPQLPPPHFLTSPEGTPRLNICHHFNPLCTGGTYYVPHSFLLISNKFCNGGGAARAGPLSSFMHLSGTSRVIKFLYAPAPPTPTVWALKPPSLALVHKTTYASMVFTALCIMFWMHAYPLRRQVGGVWALNIESFLGPVKWHQADRRVPFV
jgi:hypothetical protein